MISSDINRPAKSTVALTGVTSYDHEELETGIDKQFSLLDIGRGFSRGDRVLVKPNLIVPRPASQCCQTDPAVILAVCRKLKDLGAKPFVADSPAWGKTVDCLRALEVTGPLEEMDVPFCDLDKPVKKDLPDWDGPKIQVSSVALEADKIVNLPKFKAHQQLGATFAVKNMFGVVTGKRKAWLHYARGRTYSEFCRMLIGIYRLMDPVITIIDGITAMESMGPINGDPRQLNVLVGGTDPVACEKVCCKIACIDEQSLPILQEADKMCYGCSSYEDIEISGEQIGPFICSSFKQASMTPLRFTLPHVIKSIGKQLVLLMKSGK